MPPKIADILHDVRLSILNALHSGKTSFAEISKDIPKSKPEVSRHLNKLIEQHLVEKTDTYNITDLGSLVLDIMAPINIITKYYDFFSNHSLNSLPLGIVRNLDLLHKSELMHGTGFIMKKMEEIAQMPTHEIHMIIDQPFPDFRNDVVLSGVFIVPNRMKLIENFEGLFKQKYNSYRVRSMQSVLFPMGIINDKYGFLFFPDNKGVPDYNYCIYTEDEDGIKFIKMVWEHVWGQSTPLFYKKYSQN